MRETIAAYVTRAAAELRAECLAGRLCTCSCTPGVTTRKCADCLGCRNAARTWAWLRVGITNGGDGNGGNANTLIQADQSVAKRSGRSVRPLSRRGRHGHLVGMPAAISWPASARPAPRSPPRSPARRRRGPAPGAQLAYADGAAPPRAIPSPACRWRSYFSRIRRCTR